MVDQKTDGHFWQPKHPRTADLDPRGLDSNKTATMGTASCGFSKKDCPDKAGMCPNQWVPQCGIRCKCPPFEKL